MANDARLGIRNCLYNLTSFNGIEGVFKIYLYYSCILLKLQFLKCNLVACMILSAPPLISSADSVCVCLAMHFATKRRKTSPTAIGRTPPFNFFKAVKEALRKLVPLALGADLCWPNSLALLCLLKSIIEIETFLKSMTHILMFPAINFFW